MNYSSGVYEFIHFPGEKEDVFCFVSMGVNSIMKTIEYTQLENIVVSKSHPLLNKSIFNLGFGNYTDNGNEIIDDVVSNNGDVFKVFNTVLKTIPVFFNYHENCAIMVRGSDSKSSFANKCKITCKKRCINECKNVNRRINIYKNYINKNFELLCITYKIYGGVSTPSRITIFDRYELKNNYDTVFLIKK